MFAPLRPHLLPALVGLASLGLLAGCDRGKLEAQIGPQTPEQNLREAIGKLREEGLLEPAQARRVRVGTPLFFERLEGLDRFLDELAVWDDGPPAWWDPAQRPDLDDRLEPLGRFYEDLSSLLEHPDVLDALRSGGSLGHRTSPREGPMPPAEVDRWATPPLERVSRWVDLLLARAVAGGDDPGRSEEVVRSLADAFDLLRLLEDGSMRGTRIVVALETSCLQALHVIGPGPMIDAELLRAELDPRLAICGDRRRLWDSLEAETSRRIRIVETILGEPGRTDEDYWLLALGTSRARAPERGLDAIWVQNEMRTAASVCERAAQFGPRGGGHPFQDTFDGVGELHDIGLQATIARLGLALNAWHVTEGDWPRYLSDVGELFPDGMPILDCRVYRVEYKRAYRMVFVEAIDRRGGKKEPDPLLRWEWDAQVLQQFEDLSR